MRQMIFALSAIALVLSVGVAVRADIFSDDLTVCCAQINSPDTMPAVAMINPLNPMVLGCRAIDGSPKSVSACPGVVLGCSENAFLCQPSTDFAGLMDCTCRSGGAMLGFGAGM